MDVAPIVAALLCLAAIALVIQALRWLARRHRAMYAEISARCADVQVRAAVRALVYDQTPVSPPIGDGPAATGAGTSPDPAPVVVPHRVRVEMGGHGRHAKEAA